MNKMFSAIIKWFKPSEPEQDQALEDESTTEQLAAPLIKEKEDSIVDNASYMDLESVPELAEINVIKTDAPNMEYKEEPYRRTDKKD